MFINMKNRDLFELQRQLEAVKDLEGVKFSFVCARNKRTITPVIEALEEASKPKEAFVEFETERGELLKKYAKKDENGEPVTIQLNENSVQYDIEDVDKLNKAVEKLKKKHAEAITERENQIAEYEKLLDDEFDVDSLSRMDTDILPKGITLGQILTLRRLLDFEDFETESVELSRREILKLDEAVMPFVESEDFDFNIRLAYNYLNVAPVIIETKTAISPSEEYTEFSNKFQMVAMKYAKKDDNGKMVFNEETGSLSLDESKYDEMNNELTKLRKEYSDAIDAFNAKQEENAVYLKEKVTVDLALIDIDDLPSNLTPDRLSGIDYMVSM